MVIEPIPEETGVGDQGLGISLGRSGETESTSEDTLSAGIAASDATHAKLKRGLLEARMEAALAVLTELAVAPTSTLRQGHLALLKRWYYRPEARRTGEIFFPDPEDRWPV